MAPTTDSGLCAEPAYCVLRDLPDIIRLIYGECQYFTLNIKKEL